MNVKKGKKKLTIVSLFAGAGGLDFAVCSTGLVERLFSSDRNEIFLQTVVENFSTHFPYVDHRYFRADAHELTKYNIYEKLETDEIDIVIGGPPCDDFTPFGKKRGANGMKAPLIFEYSRLVTELRPRAFLFENVPNLTRQFKDFFEDFLGTFPQEYVPISWKILAAMNYGSPTLRKRVFAVGFLEKAKQQLFRFPQPTHGETNKQLALFEENNKLKPYNQVRAVLKGIPDVTKKQASKYLNHTGRRHRPATVEHLKTVPQGVSVRQSYRYRAPWDGLCRSLTAGLDDSTKSYIHPIFHREMSVREYARIHGFPDSWFFKGNHHNGIKQVANAVPIPLGIAIVRSIIQVL